MKNTNDNNKTNFPVNATKGAQVLALVFVIGAAVFTNGDQTAIAANASVQPHSGILISTPPPPPPTHNLKARKGAYIAGEGHSRANTFASFYKQTQIELFSALDNALSQKAEDTLTEFAAVKKADVQLQTQLGNRQGQIAANVIGAFAESQSTAFGWQVRVYGGENDSKGANAGIFFRRVDGESLYGINTFADYEKGDYGEFLRYGIGGELQNRYASFAMNYYLPITDDKHKGSTVAFSQKGYDANLRINIPQLDFLKVAADYYHFDGKYGGENDKGFRYGLELQPINNLRIGAFYDDGGEKFGGDIVYVYNIAAPANRESKDAFSPDLFAPVLREYSQRIITATTGPGISLSIRAIMTTFTTMTAELITRTTTFSTMAGVEVRTTTEMTVPSRRASVQVILRFDEMPNAYVVVSTEYRYLLTLPPMTTTRPWVITTSINLDPPGHDHRNNVIESNFTGTGNQYAFISQVLNHTLTVVEGSEVRIGMMTLTTRMTTTEDVITAMTMAMTMQGMATTMAMTAFLTTTITLGLPTTTIGAAIDNSHLPPSFPPSSFPQVPKLALAAIPRSQLSFPRRRESNRAFGAVIIA